MCRSACLLLLALFLTACGGSSGSGDDDAPAPPETPPPTTPAAVERLDAMPEASVTQADPGIPDSTVSHLGYSDFSLDLGGDCTEGTTLQRSLRDLSSDFDALFEHLLFCDSLQATGAYETRVRARRPDGDEFEVRRAFSTTTRTAPALQVQDATSTPRGTVAELFQTVVDDSLLDELDLPAAVAALIEESVELIAESAFDALLDPEPLYGVTAQRVSYASRRPDGSASSELTGLVVVPDTADSTFTPRESIIVLSHSTGVTPSDLDVSDPWYIVAQLFAARGYLVIAPDNWGRGGTASEPETFLMAGRTAANSLDLIRAVLADPGYDDARASGTPRLTLVGYSQGGHSAIALWLAIAAQAQGLEVAQVFAGAGPYDLYATARGVVVHASGACTGGAYCRYVSDDTTVPFLTERVLPGYLAHAADDLQLADLVDGEALTPAFVDGFLGNDPAFDGLKGLLQQSSFTNITSGLEALAGTATRFTLFHSEYDRLVPIANSEALVGVLERHFPVELREDPCNSDAYAAIFEITDRVGISHALCGLEMFDEVYAELRQE